MINDKNLLKSPKVNFKPTVNIPSPISKKSSPKRSSVKKKMIKKSKRSSLSVMVNKKNELDLSSSESELYFKEKISFSKIKKEINEINQNIKMMLVKEKSSDISDEATIIEMIKKIMKILYINLSCCKEQDVDKGNEIDLK